MPKSLPGLRKSTLGPLTAAIAAAVGSSAWIQRAEAQVDAATPQAPEEMTVTASRRETTVQELPFNVSAVSGVTLENLRLTTLTEFSRWVPGLTVVDQGARSASLMTARGLNVLSVNASEYLDNGSGGTVATYLGEIPLYVDLKMKDIERIEVLLGPQGTLYGAGTLGGAVRYIPRAPQDDALSIDVRGNVYDVAQSGGLGYETDVVVNVPILSDRLAFRGSLSYLDDPGFIDYPYLVRDPGVSNPEPDFTNPAEVAANLREQEDADRERTLSSRLALRWRINDAVEATFSHYFQDQDVGARSVNHNDSFQTGRYASGHRFLEPNDRQNSLLSAEVIADLGFAELTSATGISSYDEHGQRDQTDLLLGFEFGYESFPSFVAFTREVASEERLNQEVRLVSKGRAPLSWIAGIFYNEYELDAESAEFTPAFDDFIGITLPTGDLEYLQITRETLTEQALYAELTYDLSDRWSVTAGGRWFDYDDDKFLSFELPLVALANAEQNSASDDGFLGKLSTSYRFTDDLSGYATLSEGYRIGGVNSVAPCLSPLPPGQNVCALPDEVLIEPDRTTNLEVGVRARLIDDRLMLNGAVYSIDWNRIQTQGVTDNGAIPITVNGGSAQSRGLEVSLELRGDGPWSLAGNYGYNDAELTSAAPGIVDGIGDENGDGVINSSDEPGPGDRLAGTPEHRGTVRLRYESVLVNGWDLDAVYGLTVTSDVLTKVGPRGNGETLGGYSLHTVSVSVSHDQWSATLYADNLTNKFAATAVRQDPTYIRDVGSFALRRYYRDVLRPRSIGIEFRYRLGE